MPNELPSTHTKLTPTVAAPDDVRLFMAELESVAESCQTAMTNRSSIASKPQSYLEPMARKYSFAPPRRPLDEPEKNKAFVPERLMAQLKRATKSFIGVITQSHRKS